MFTFTAVLALDRLEWRMAVDNPEPSIGDFRNWVQRAGPISGYVLWPDDVRRTITAFGWGRSAEALAEIQQNIQRRLGAVVPFGRLVDVRVSILEDDAGLQEAAARVFATFSAPGGRCPGCGKTEPPHHPGCPWGR